MTPNDRTRPIGGLAAAPCRRGLIMTLRKILAVDDDPDARSLLAIALSTIGGFDARICGSAQDAMATLDEFSPDLILLDDRMPGTDGEQALRMFRGRSDGCTLPCIFLTAMSHPKNVERLSALGAISVVRKPFDPMTLGDQIRETYRQAIPSAEVKRT